MLHEMVTGKRAFDGSSQVILIAAILEHEPRPLAQLQPHTPRQLEHVVQGCLPFDVQSLARGGEPVRIADSVAISDQGTPAAAAVSNTGELVYRTATAGIQTQLVWYERTGKSLGSIGSPAQYRGIALSPDDKRVAAHIHQEPTGGDIWILDQDRGTSTRFTFHASHNFVPTWSRDGKVLTFGNVYAYDVSSDGRFVINERISDSPQNVPITAVLNWTAGLTR